MRPSRVRTLSCRGLLEPPAAGPRSPHAWSEKGARRRAPRAPFSSSPVSRSDLAASPGSAAGALTVGALQVQVEGVGDGEVAMNARAAAPAATAAVPAARAYGWSARPFAVRPRVGIGRAAGVG